MPRLPWLFLILVSLLGATVNDAHADVAEPIELEEPVPVDAWELRRLTISGQIGISTPGGLIGFDVERALKRWLVVGFGVGPTLTGDLELQGQAGVWLAPRYVFDASALGVDVGTSAGPYASPSFEEHQPWNNYDVALWMNTGARYQYLSDGGFSFRVFVGVATLLNPGSGDCGDGDESRECRRFALGYGGFAFGYAMHTGEHKDAGSARAPRFSLTHCARCSYTATPAPHLAAPCRGKLRRTE